MPCRVLYTLLGEVGRMRDERQQAIDRVKGSAKLSAFVAIPPFVE